MIGAHLPRHPTFPASGSQGTVWVVKLALTACVPTTDIAEPAVVVRGVGYVYGCEAIVPALRARGIENVQATARLIA